MTKGKERTDQRVADLYGDVIRTEMLDGIKPLIARYGGNCDAIFKQHGIDPGLLDQPDRYVCCSGYIRLLEFCAERFDAPFFALELSKLQTPNIFGTLAALIHAAKTVREALQYLTKYQSLHVPSSNIVLVEESSEMMLLTLVSRLPGMSHKRQCIELGIAILDQILKKLIGPDFRPSYLHIAATPPKADLSPIKRHFGCNVLYNQAVSSIAIPTDALTKSLSTENELLAKLVNDHLEQTRLGTDLAIEEQVDRLITTMLPLGRCNLDICAWQLGLAPRTLQALLANRDLEFSTLLARRRQLLAEDYLRDTHLPVSEIAAALGYADQTTFTRAFSSWTGCSPAKFRKASMS